MTNPGRPLQPSTIRQMAQYMCMLDPRCDFEEHNTVAQGHQCRHCKMDLFTYVEWISQGLRAWPL
jgi:hypothetical protein